MICELTLEQQYRLAARLNLYARKACRCPGRNDHKPSCTLLELGNTLYVYDFANGTKRPIVSFFPHIDGSMLNTPIENRNSPIFTANFVDPKEDAYFASFKITPQTLNFFGVKAVLQLFKNDKTVYSWSDNDPMYAYIHESGRKRFYRPLVNKNEPSNSHPYKWFGDWRIGDIFGYSPFVEKRSLLILTSSAKDTMALHEMGFKAFAFGGETISNKLLESPLMAARARLNTVVVMFDNDTAGRANATRISSRFGLKYIVPKEKDISDQLKAFPLDEVRQFVLDALSDASVSVLA